MMVNLMCECCKVHEGKVKGNKEGLMLQHNQNGCLQGKRERERTLVSNSLNLIGWKNWAQVFPAGHDDPPVDQNKPLNY